MRPHRKLYTNAVVSIFLMCDKYLHFHTNISLDKKLLM